MESRSERTVAIAAAMARVGPRVRDAWRLIAIIAVLAFALALVACGGREADAAADSSSGMAVQVGRENVAIVATDRVESGPVISGTLSPEREAQIRAEVPGSVLRILVDQGQRVVAGQELARIEDSALREALLSARSGVATAELNAELVEKELSRAQRLHEAGAIADRDLEGARRAATAATTQLAEARARLAMASQQAANASVKAPFAGVIGARTVSPGDVVAPGAQLFTVVDPASMRLEASVPAEALASIRLGAPVRFTVTGYPNRPFTGRVTRISPAADPVTRQVRIVVTLPASGQLVAGLFAEGRVATETKLVPSVPLGAVDRRGLEPTVLRIRNGLVEKVVVQLGLVDEIAERVEVTGGVAVGDTLLLGSAQGVSEGTAVRVTDPSDTARR